MRESKKLGLITDHGKLILERGTCTFWNIKLVMKQPCWMLDRWSSPVECWSSTLSHGNSDIYECNLLSGHANNDNLFVPAEHLLNYSITKVAYKQWLHHCCYQIGHIVSTIMSIWCAEFTVIRIPVHFRNLQPIYGKGSFLFNLTFYFNWGWCILSNIEGIHFLLVNEPLDLNFVKLHMLLLNDLIYTNWQH